MRHFITLIENLSRLVETVRPQGTYYLHVSPGANLKSILAAGLQQNTIGNYSGYERSLPGVYVTRAPGLIRDHIFAREIADNYLLILVRVATPAVIDEDVLDNYLADSLRQVEATTGMDEDELVEKYYHDADYPYKGLGRKMLPFMLKHLGKVSRGSSKTIQPLLAEFCAAWFGHHLGGDGPDDDWWMDTKERIINAFPDLTHATHGADYSIRLPSPIGFEGETRIVGVVQVKRRKAQIAWGQVPPEAEKMVNDCLS